MGATETERTLAKTSTRLLHVTGVALAVPECVAAAVCLSLAKYVDKLPSSKLIHPSP